MFLLEVLIVVKNFDYMITESLIIYSACILHNHCDSVLNFLISNYITRANIAIKLRGNVSLS